MYILFVVNKRYIIKNTLDTPIERHLAPDSLEHFSWFLLHHLWMVQIESIESNHEKFSKFSLVRIRLISLKVMLDLVGYNRLFHCAFCARYQVKGGWSRRIRVDINDSEFQTLTQLHQPVNPVEYPIIVHFRTLKPYRIYSHFQIQIFTSQNLRWT